MGKVNEKESNNGKQTKVLGFAGCVRKAVPDVVDELRSNLAGVLCALLVGFYLGKLNPETSSLQREKVELAVAGLIRVLSWSLYLPTQVLDLLTTCSVRLFGIVQKALKCKIRRHSLRRSGIP